EPHRDALAVPRRIRIQENLRDLGPREPAGKLAAGAEKFLPHLSARDGGGPRRPRDPRLLFVTVFVGEVHHLAKRHHTDPELRLKPRHELLSVAGSVERLARPVEPRTRLVATHDEVAGTIVPPNQRMPHRLARPGHSHGER